MLNLWHGMVESVQQRAPPLVPIGLAEADRVIFQFLPAHQKEVAAWRFQAGAHFKAKKARRCRNQWQRLPEGGLVCAGPFRRDRSRGGPGGTLASGSRRPPFGERGS